MQKADTLIRTKLRLPHTRPGLVDRPRLREQIAHGLRGPLTLITAPAGFGKTTLVASAITGGMPIEPRACTAWLSLDKNDNQPGRFLNYLAAALQTADSTIGREAAQLLAASAPPEAVLTSLVNDLDESDTETVLVLDDYQLITNPVVHEQVAFLLDHCPRTFHLVIATRSDPPLPLSRLRARGQTVELRAADLRFSENEAVQFINEVMGLGLDTASVAVLAERTEGWVAGLQMASLALQGSLARQGREEVERFIQAFAGTHRFIMDFMLEEVLARELQEVQDFLLKTSILTRLSGPLCDAVTGAAGGQEMLERLERRNLFIVPLDDDRRWYRYHHLFSDLLQARLYQTGAERVAGLFARAAEWCEREGQITEAVNYTFAAQDYPRAVRLVERYWQPVSNNGEIDTVWSWLKALPEDRVRDSAPLGMAYCGILWMTGQVSAIETHLPDAERALAKIDLAKEIAQGRADYAQLPAALTDLRSFVARYHEDFDTASTLARQAISLIPADQPPEDTAQLSGLVYLALASALDGGGDLPGAVEAYTETIRWSRLARNATGLAITYRMVGALRLLGRLRAAESACRDALDYLQAQGMSRLPAAGILHLALSEILVERNELNAAQAHLAQAVQLGKWSGRLDTVKNAAYGLSRIRLAQGDAAGALAAVEEAEAALIDPPSPLAKADLLALKARVLIRQGALREAALCADEAVRLVGQERGQTGQMVALAAARVRAAQPTPTETDTSGAAKTAAQLSGDMAAAEECGRLGAALELRILHSLALSQQNDRQAAEADLERALALAESEGYARLLIDEGQPMQMLITGWLAHAQPGPLRDYALRLLAQIEAEQSHLPAAQAEATPAAGLVKGRLVEPEVHRANQQLIEPLSQRELEVLRLMALGKTNQEIAEKLIVTRGTIKAHAASIYRKLDAANRTEAVARARRLGILS